MAIKYEFEINYECDHCGENHEISMYRCTDYEYDDDVEECVCGATIEVDWSVTFDVNIDCGLPPEEEVEEEAEEEEPLKPGPNQIDMFTGKTVSEMEELNES